MMSDVTATPDGQNFNYTSTIGLKSIIKNNNSNSIIVRAASVLNELPDDRRPTVEERIRQLYELSPSIILCYEVVNGMVYYDKPVLIMYAQNSSLNSYEPHPGNPNYFVIKTKSERQELRQPVQLEANGQIYPSIYSPTYNMYRFLTALSNYMITDKGAESAQGLARLIALKLSSEARFNEFLDKVTFDTATYLFFCQWQLQAASNLKSEGSYDSGSLNNPTEMPLDINGLNTINEKWPREGPGAPLPQSFTKNAFIGTNENIYAILAVFFNSVGARGFSRVWLTKSTECSEYKVGLIEPPQSGPCVDSYLKSHVDDGNELLNQIKEYRQLHNLSANADIPFPALVRILHPYFNILTLTTKVFEETASQNDEGIIRAVTWSDDKVQFYPADESLRACREDLEENYIIRHDSIYYQKCYDAFYTKDGKRIPNTPYAQFISLPSNAGGPQEFFISTMSINDLGTVKPVFNAVLSNDNSENIIQGYPEFRMQGIRSRTTNRVLFIYRNHCYNIAEMRVDRTGGLLIKEEARPKWNAPLEFGTWDTETFNRLDNKTDVLSVDLCIPKGQYVQNYSTIKARGDLLKSVQVLSFNDESCVNDFLDTLISYHKLGKHFNLWAHNGSGFDNPLILGCIFSNNSKMHGSPYIDYFSKRVQFIQAGTSIKQMKFAGHVFYDSYNHLADNLNNLCKTMIPEDEQYHKLEWLTNANMHVKDFFKNFIGERRYANHAECLKVIQSIPGLDKDFEKYAVNDVLCLYLIVAKLKELYDLQTEEVLKIPSPMCEKYDEQCPHCRFSHKMMKDSLRGIPCTLGSYAMSHYTAKREIKHIYSAEYWKNLSMLEGLYKMKLKKANAIWNKCFKTKFSLTEPYYESLTPELYVRPLDSIIYRLPRIDPNDENLPAEEFDDTHREEQRDGSLEVTTERKRVPKIFYAIQRSKYGGMSLVRSPYFGRLIAPNGYFVSVDVKSLYPAVMVGSNYYKNLGTPCPWDRIFNRPEHPFIGYPCGQPTVYQPENMYKVRNDKIGFYNVGWIFEDLTKGANGRTLPSLTRFARIPSLKDGCYNWEQAIKVSKSWWSQAVNDVDQSQVVNYLLSMREQGFTIAEVDDIWLSTYALQDIEYYGGYYGLNPYSYQYLFPETTYDCFGALEVFIKLKDQQDAWEKKKDPRFNETKRALYKAYINIISGKINQNISRSRTTFAKMPGFGDYENGAMLFNKTWKIQEPDIDLTTPCMLGSCMYDLSKRLMFGYMDAADWLVYRVETDSMLLSPAGLEALNRNFPQAIGETLGMLEIEKPKKAPEDAMITEVILVGPKASFYNYTSASVPDYSKIVAKLKGGPKSAMEGDFKYVTNEEGKIVKVNLDGTPYVEGQNAREVFEEIVTKGSYELKSSSFRRTWKFGHIGLTAVTLSRMMKYPKCGLRASINAEGLIVDFVPKPPILVY